MEKEYHVEYEGVIVARSQQEADALSEHIATIIPLSFACVKTLSCEVTVQKRTAPAAA